jgi:hypothetical protein
MPDPVALPAERDEVSLGIIAQFAARGEMVDLKLVWRSTVLAAPAVALEHAATQATIRVRLKP